MFSVADYVSVCTNIPSQRDVTKPAPMFLGIWSSVSLIKFLKPTPENPSSRHPNLVNFSPHLKLEGWNMMLHWAVGAHGQSSLTEGHRPLCNTVGRWPQGVCVCLD